MAVPVTYSDLHALKVQMGNLERQLAETVQAITDNAVDIANARLELGLQANRIHALETALRKLKE